MVVVLFGEDVDKLVEVVVVDEASVVDKTGNRVFK